MRIFVCSRLRGDSYHNVEAAKDYCLWVARAGHAPFAPHLFCPGFLDDADSGQRESGMSIGKAWLEVSDEVWVFVVNGVVSEGMTAEIEHAVATGIPVRWHAVSRAGLIEALPHLPPMGIPEVVDLLGTSGYRDIVMDKLAEVGHALRSGTYTTELDAEIGRLLGDNGVERDRNLEAAWERSRDGNY